MGFEGIDEATFAELAGALESRSITSVELVNAYLRRVDELDRAGPQLRSVITTNPDALEIARQLDAEREAGRVRGPLHGLPILVKDNIDTGDGMATTAGSLALAGAPASEDAPVVAKLRAAGAVVFGKTNLSEWANFRSERSTSGWSAVGGQCRNPYVLDRTPCGSSSGSAVAVSANLAAGALGTETHGSIVCPSAVCGVVGIKPTVGVTSRTGVVPISNTQDSVGVHARTVRDAAQLLGVIAESEIDYASACIPDGLRGARIGVARQRFFGYSATTDAIVEDALETIRDAGAVLIDPADLPSAEELYSSEAEMTVLLYEFKAGIADYLGRRPELSHRTLEDVIAFNAAHATEELRLFGQDLFLRAAETRGLDDPEYLEARVAARRLGAENGIDAVMDRLQLDALVAPTTSPAWVIDQVNGDYEAGGSAAAAAVAGYPLITVPAGHAFGELPVGLTFMGRAHSEEILVRLAFGFEQMTQARRPPRFRPTLPLS